jgi:DnaJ-class molecular chaperone
MNIPGYDAWRLRGPEEATEPEMVDCDNCDGRGFVNNYGSIQDCGDCEGMGVVPAELEEPDGDYEYQRRRDAMEDRG